MESLKSEEQPPPVFRLVDFSGPVADDAAAVVGASSRHPSRAMDLTLVADSVAGREVDMGTPYDTFSPAAHFGNATGRVLEHRQLLRRAMESEGFRQYEQEWWHYSFEVPGETPAFDMVVK
jgi:D-alanyl-D-alanine dipeptidase